MANPNIPAKFTEIVRFDWFIKYMFRDKADFEILEGFLSELLKENITILEILESESNSDQKDDKFNQVYLFKNSQIEDHFKAKGIEKAKQKLAVAKLSKRKRTAYEQYVRNLHDEASWNAHQHFKNETVVQMQVERKVKETLDKAVIEAKLEVAKNLLQNGIAVELVAVATGLSIEAIQEIKF